MLQKKGHIVLLSTLFVVLFMMTILYKPEVASATIAFSPDGYTCTPCHEDPNWAKEHGITKPAEGSTKPAAPTTPTVKYVPEPYEPVVREANNALFGGGLGLVAVVIGGAIFLDKRKK